MDLIGNCQTTAMGIMPHTDIGRALELALSFDIPFWPQLPAVSYYEDMYAQASDHFPGLVVDPAAEKIVFDPDRFAEELVTYAEICDLDDTHALSPAYSVVYHHFLSLDLTRYLAIRGQVTGPVSFGFRVTDTDLRPLIYHEDARTLLFDFLQKKLNHQYRELRQKNANAFVWLDEPGLGWVFSAFSGFSDVATKEHYAAFLAGIEGPKALHLCADINLPYLLSLGLDLLSFDAYQIWTWPAEYAIVVGDFLRQGGLLGWGIVPTDPWNQKRETAESLMARIENMWAKVTAVSGIPAAQIAAQSLLAPARCCLKNAGKVGSVDDANIGPVNGARQSLDFDCEVKPTGEEALVERGFARTIELSRMLRDKYRL